MPRRSLLALSAVVAWLAGCSRAPADDAKPVATPSASVSPAVVASGAPMQLSLTFAVAPDAPPFREDYRVFVHVLDSGGRMIGAADHDPPSPTRSWEPGSKVQYTQSAFAPTTRYVGMARLVIGLYSPSTGERVPLSGEAVERRAIDAGSFELREQSDPYAVAFREGWYAPEVDRPAGLEWRWSTKSAGLSFPNPRRPMELVAELDQPAMVFTISQHVEFRVGDSVVDAFDLEPRTRILRRIALTPSQLGEDPTVELSVVSDKTFIPADLPDLHSDDTRQLGIRVFRVYVEPK